MAAFNLCWFLFVEFRAYIFDAKVHASEYEQYPNNDNKYRNDKPDLFTESQACLKAVVKRKDAGMLSPTMPKSESQYNALTKENSGLNFMDGAKKGKMIKARGGGMAIQGMKPTKLY